MTIVLKPRWSGTNGSGARATNSSSSESPVMTSGMTSGAVTMPASIEEPPEPREPEPRRHPKHPGAGHRDARDAKAQPHAREHLRVVEQHAVPLQREPAPHRHEPRLVERVHDHRQDRDVEEQKPEHEH